MKVWIVVRSYSSVTIPDIVGVTPDYKLAARMMADDFMSECVHGDISPMNDEDAWMDAFSGAIVLNNEQSIFWHIERKELCHV